MKKGKYPDIAPENYLWVCLENGKCSSIRSELSDSWDQYSAENSRLIHISNIMWNADHTKIIAFKNLHEYFL
ncbi:MAG: hypothetical protein JW915_10220 [Chitinispirillaceae bacterium]|nr:hypothetical protein [Chitinispirillaceae bacterium]